VVVESEPIFRTNFRLDAQNGLLVEQEKTSFSWPGGVVYSEIEYEKETRAMGKTSEVGSSFKVVIFFDFNSSQPPKCIIVWRIHHALIDGHSSRLVLRKLQRRLEGFPVESGLSLAQFAKQLDDFGSIHRLEGQRFWKRQKEQYTAARGLHL
jgi:hypothetical protein